MDELIGLVAVIGIFIFPVAALGTGWVILLRNRHEERIKMIDKGVILAEPERSPNRYPALRNGLFMVGLAIGLIVGMFVEPSVPENDFEFMVIPTFAVLFGATSSPSTNGSSFPTAAGSSCWQASRRCSGGSTPPATTSSV